MRYSTRAVEDVIIRLKDGVGGGGGGGLAEDTTAKERRPGRAMRWIRWNTWEAIQGEPASEAIRARLGLGEHDFA